MAARRLGESAPRVVELPPSDWRAAAGCVGSDVDFFPMPADDHRPAQRVCQGCPVVLECLETALVAEQGLGLNHRAGVYGGLTPQQRYDATRRRKATA